jgi:membrane protease YdiL (CAAX protease family)
VLHYSQYDIYGVMTIFIFGIALGVIRLVTKSLWATIAVHAFWNFLAMVMTVLVINGIIQ